MQLPPHRPRRNSPEYLHQIYLDLHLPVPQLPDHLDLPREALPYWEAVMRGRPRASWNPALFPIAADLARTMSAINSQYAAMSRSFRAHLKKPGDARTYTIAELERHQFKAMRALGLIGGRRQKRTPASYRDALLSWD